MTLSQYSLPQSSYTNQWSYNSEDKAKKERLELFCKLKDYEIVDYYTDEGISAKRGNYRPEYERLQNELLDGYNIKRD